MRRTDPLSAFRPAVRRWFEASFAAPTVAQAKGWPPILGGKSTLLLAPTGSGKTLAAFLAAIDRLMFSPEPPKRQRARILYVSPLKALAVDVERNLRAPIAGIAAAAGAAGETFRIPAVAIRSGDTPAADRARMARTPPDIIQWWEGKRLTRSDIREEFRGRSPYSLSEMEGNLARRADRAAARTNYVQALAVVEYLFELHGSGAVACLTRDLGEGRTFSEALRAETGLTPEGLFRRWKEWAKL